MVLDSDADYAMYCSLIPLYFPRSKEDFDVASKLLPRDNGNEWGESVIKDVRRAAREGRRDFINFFLLSFLSESYSGRTCWW